MSETTCDCCGEKNPKFECTSVGLFWPPDILGARYCHHCCGMPALEFADRVRLRREQIQAPHRVKFELCKGCGLAVGVFNMHQLANGDSPYCKDCCDVREAAKRAETETKPVCIGVDPAVPGSDFTAITLGGVPLPLSLSRKELIASQLGSAVRAELQKILKPRLHEFTIDIHIGNPPKQADAGTCCDCSSPATDGARCVYCAHRRDREPIAEEFTHARNLARARNEAALAAERPRETRQSREMAKGHPSTWPSQDGEP